MPSIPPEAARVGRSAPLPDRSRDVCSCSVALWDLDPTGRFADRASDYVKYRPSYPASAIDAVLGGCGEPSSLHAADIGAGTGISARLLGDRGVRMVAVEPNAAMRNSAEPHPGVVFHDGTAEVTNLNDAAVDLVLCAQAFHWFRSGPRSRSVSGSCDDVPKRGEGGDRLLELLRALHEHHADPDGFVTLVYTTTVHLFERRSEVAVTRCAAAPCQE